MIYTCDTCRFIFSRAGEPEQCPNCGKYAIRPADEDERREYAERLKESSEQKEGRRRPQKAKERNDA